ncbi:MAG: polyisoprenoid-binding protein [Acidobacteria bacterium]|nr:MAG: polyisoprenoid-binding protein [Acidobacteriota bacterium]
MAQTQQSPAIVTWNIDPAHSNAQFSVRHLMISNVKGEFTRVSGVVRLDKDNPEGVSVEASIDVNTINTREPDRDNHLKSPDFFDVAKHPTITFKSKRVAKSPGGLKLKGDLTIHGVTREVTLDVEGPTPPTKDPWGNTRIGASATTKINRKDFGLTWNQALETGGVMVGEEVKITIDVELVAQAGDK